MRLLWHKTTTKVFGDHRSNNEDAFLRCKTRGEDISRFVMCDGATSSYAARVWSNALVSRFAETGEISDKDRVYAAAKEYEAKYPPTALAGMDHSAIESFKRGSSSTLLLVEQDKSNRNLLHLTAVGDTCFFVVDDKYHILKSFPLENSSDFSTSAYLITVTFEGLKQLFDEQTSLFYWKRCDIDMGEFPGARLMCATDAVSQWITANKECPKAIERLFKAVKSPNRRKFVGFIEFERSRKTMPVDDSTVAILEV